MNKVPTAVMGTAGMSISTCGVLAAYALSSVFFFELAFHSEAV
jgi:hypothetical protein